MRLLGIDYGTKRVGIAMTDVRGTMAFPKAVMKNDTRLIPALAALIEKEGITAAVVGESKNLSGKDNRLMKDIRAFIEKLTSVSGVPVYLEPEFYTSREARRLALDAPSRKRGAPVDAEAAAIILTSYLSHT